MVRISPLLYMASWILSVCLALCCLRCTALTVHYISFGLNDLNADCVSSAVTSFSSVAGVRSSRCDHLPVGVGRRSAPLLRSSRSLSFTTRNWSTNNENSNILMVECYSIPCWGFFPSLQPWTLPPPIASLPSPFQPLFLPSSLGLGSDAAFNSISAY